jgi:hypothetical protein
MMRLKTAIILSASLCNPFLARCRKNVTMMPMKLALAVLVYLLIGLVLSWGILLLLAGKPWLFIAAFLAYIVAFGKIGCKQM